MAKRVIAFNIGDRYIRILEFTYSFSGLRIQSLKTLRYKGRGDWRTKARAAIEQVFEGLKKDDVEVISLLPGHTFFIRRYTFPFFKKKTIQDVLRFEMDGDIPIPVEDAVFDYTLSGRRNKDYELIVFIAPRDTVEEYLSLFPKDFKPTFMMPDLVALSHLDPQKGIDNYSIIEVESDRISMVAMINGALRAARSLSTAGSTPQLILKGIVQTINLWKESGIEPGSFYLAGEVVGALSKDRIESETGMKSGDILDLRLFKGVEDPGTFVSLLGLSQGFLQNSLNLLRSDIEEKDREVRQKRLRIMVAGIAVIAILGMSDLYLRFNILKGRLDTIDTSIDRTFRKILPDIKRVVKPVVQLKTALKENKDRLEALEGGNIIDFNITSFIDRLFKEADRLDLTLLKVDVEKGEINFEGETKKPDRLQIFVKRLKGDKNVVDVNIKGIEKGVDASRFRGVMAIRGRPSNHDG